jgi:hypothetical protein
VFKNRLSDFFDALFKFYLIPRITGLEIMVDIERVVTLDDLVESVPEDLVRRAELEKVALKSHLAKSQIEEVKYSVGGSDNMSKELSKAQRIRLYMENNPGVRNKEVVEALKHYSVTAADVANVKSIAKKQGGKESRSYVPEVSAPRASRAESSTGMTNPGASITLPELEAGVAFVKAAGSIMRAKHLLIIIEQIKAC